MPPTSLARWLTAPRRVATLTFLEKQLLGKLGVFAPLPMYGVPSDLPLDRLIGRDLDCIILCRYQISFSFDGGACITPTTAWELRDPSGALLDSAQEHDQRESYRVHQIIGIPVSSFSIDAPRSFSLVFASGHCLIISDDSEQYESCTVEFEGQPTIII